MTEFTVADTLRLAKRFNNPKRSWLLVNPLQAKHIPVSPGAALAMMRELGERLSRRYPECGLVIGFAETATAIGAAVAGCLAGIIYGADGIPGEWLDALLGKDKIESALQKFLSAVI